MKFEKPESMTSIQRGPIRITGQISIACSVGRKEHPLCAELGGFTVHGLTVGQVAHANAGTISRKGANSVTGQ